MLEIKRILEIDQKLIALLNQTFKKGEPDGKSGDWNLENVKEFVKISDNIFLLAYFDNQIAGMISAYKLQRMDDKKSELFFYEIGVVKDFRQKGVGKALIEELKKTAKEMNVTEMFVLTNKSNIPAMKLYTSTGGIVAKETDEVMFEYKL